MFFVSCDPSTKKPAFAIYKDNKLIDFFKIHNDFNEINTVFLNFKKEEFILGIETQYFGLNVATLAKLVENRTLITTLAIVNYCKDVKLIPPQSWQSAILGTNKNQKREQRKYIARLVSKPNSQIEN